MFSNFTHANPNQHSLMGKLTPAVVVNNNDPTKNQRVQYRVATLHTNIQDSDLPWALPCMCTSQGFIPGVGQYGVPVPGSNILILFAEDDDNHGHYIGDYPSNNNQISEFITNYPNAYGWADTNGNLFLIDTVAKTVNFVQGVTGTNIQIDSSGDINLYSSTAIKMKAPNILLDGNVQMGSGVDSGLMAVTRSAPSPANFNNQINY